MIVFGVWGGEQWEGSWLMSLHTTKETADVECKRLDDEADAEAKADDRERTGWFSVREHEVKT